MQNKNKKCNQAILTRLQNKKSVQTLSLACRLVCSESFRAGCLSYTWQAGDYFAGWEASHPVADDGPKVFNCATYPEPSVPRE